MPGESLAQSLSGEMRHHIFQELGFKAIKEYLDWCEENHFRGQVNKTKHQIRSEREFARTVRAEEALKRKHGTRNLAQALVRIWNGNLGEEDPLDEPLQIIAQACRKQGAPPRLLAFLQHLARFTCLLEDKRYTIAVLNAEHFRGDWIRDWSGWTPKSHNTERQFSELVRHLLGSYPVPDFMDQVWHKKNRTRQRWFIHLGRGGNIRTASGLPLPLTKKMAHYFLGAPATCTPEAALRWGQLLALGGNPRTAGAILGTQVVRDFRDNDFVLELMRFLIRHPMLDTRHYRPIVDYVWNQRYENHAVFVERGVAVQRGPAQPRLSLKGRTPESLLRQVEDWHVRLGRSSHGGLFRWARSRLQELEWVEGRKGSRNMKIWRIRELLSSLDLEAEGKAMGHCVATYAHSCHRGLSSIWSMSCETEIGVARHLTLEVSPRTREIVQARGRRNRLPEEKEIEVLRRWATREGLRIAQWLW
jgi:hypothetical protein